jgi:hypothetical protein
MSALITTSATLLEERRHQIAGLAVTEAAFQQLAGRLPSHPLRAPARPPRALLRGPAGRIRVELVEVRCERRAGASGGAASEEVTFGGAALLPDLSLRPLGPFRLPPFQAAGEAQLFDPPLDVMTFALAPSFGQGCVVVLQACENDGLGGPERIPGLLARVLAEVTAGVQAELGDTRGRTLPVVEEVGRVVSLLREMPGHDCLTAVVGSPALPFPEGGSTGPGQTLTFSRTGPQQLGAYTFRFQLAALPA